MDVADIPVPAALAGLRRVPLDGVLLLFDRRTGLTALCDGPETAHLRQRAPRVVQFAITNACNLACTFCSRDLDAASGWTADDAFATLAALADAGTVEVAFGGGEPLVFRGFAALARRLHAETPLAVSVTSNGTRLDDAMIDALAPSLAQLRISIYDDVDHRPILRRAAGRLRLGVNWLVTPARLDRVEATVLALYELGVRDVLLLSYNGVDRGLHLRADQAADLAARVRALAVALRGRVQLKLDVCWGERVEAVPRLLDGPCPAGRDFVVLTSDRRLAPCSFHHASWPVRDAADVLRVWDAQRAALAAPARDPGCARRADYGLGGG
ncbi:MAG: radical SAM protein [Kofleriaceae bacterium]|nr:radical SAM protein [Myxococcales bacterium]MCB9564482.1 radical SAM protein [Kofleriaceae bacterium]MCB9573907.1 radical SAM protein [Kofleriaceae bacterium]